MNAKKFNFIDLSKDQKETLFNSFKAIYEKVISNFTHLNSLSPSQINSFIESTANNILSSEREQFIFYIAHIISEFSNFTNMKAPKFTSQFQEDIQNFNKKYDNDGQLSKILFKLYCSKEYNSKNNFENGGKSLSDNQKFKEIPKIQSFYPHFLGFSYEANLMRAMLFDLRTIVITSQNAFSLFLKKIKQKMNVFYQIQKKETYNNHNDRDNELISKEREKVSTIKKKIQILRDENDKFKLKVRGEIIIIINLINSLNSNKESNSYRITFDEINKQSKKLIKMLENDSILNEDLIENDHLRQNDISNVENHNNIENVEKLKLIKQIKEQNDTILNLRSQLADLKVELFKTSLNKSNYMMKNIENSQNEIQHIEYFMPQALSSKKLNSIILNNDSDMSTNELINKGEMFNENFESNSVKSHKSINESSLTANDSVSVISHIQNHENLNFPRNLNNHKFEIEELKRQLKHSKSLIEQLTDQNKQKDKAIARLSEKLQDSSSKFDVLFDKIHLLRKKNKMLKKSKYTNDNATIDDGSSSVSVYGCTRENLLVEQISDRTNELIYKDTIIIELENENRKLQAQIELMKENNYISSRQVSSLKDDIQHIKDSSINDLDELSRQLNEKQVLIRKQADKISEFQQIKDKSEKYQKLKVANKELVSKYQSLLDDFNKNKIKAEKVFEINKMKNEKLKSKYSSLKEKYEKKKQVNISLVEQNKKLMGEIESLQKLTNGKISPYQSEASSSNSQSLTD